VAKDKPEASGLKLNTQKTTVKERGANLPLGMLGGDAGAYARNIAVREWTLVEERSIGAERDANRDANIAQFVSMILSQMCTKFGRHDFESMKPAERRANVGQAFMGDVFYAYVWLRIQAMGNVLSLNLTCPNCLNKFEFAADLDTVEVTTADKLQDAQWEYELFKPLEVRGKTVKKLLMGPAYWNALEMMSSTGSGFDSGAAKSAIILGSIHGLADYKDKDGKAEVVALASHELDRMNKRDIERLTAAIDKNAIGPDMSVEDKCGRCKRTFKLSIDWSYDSFFGDSSS